MASLKRDDDEKSLVDSSTTQSPPPFNPHFCPSRETFASMDQAPLPPAMIAASFEDEPTKAGSVLEDGIVHRGSGEQTGMPFEGRVHDEELGDLGRSREANTEDRPHYTANANSYAGTSPIAAAARSFTAPIAATPRVDNNASFLASQVETSTSTTEETMLHQPPLPLLEATLVEEEPVRERERVYEAVPLGHAWLSSKCKGVIFGSVLAVSAAIVTVVVVTTTKNKTPMESTSAPTTAPLSQLSRIVGSFDDKALGSSVALSNANATIMVVGDRGSRNKPGKVVVYRKDQYGFNTPLGQPIKGYFDGDYFGYSVDITPEGTTIICGSPGYPATNYNVTGHVRVFKLDIGTDTWEQIGQNITGDAVGDEFGWSVSISDDGKVIAVSAYRNDGINGEDSGRVKLYRLDDEDSSWEQIGTGIDGSAIDHHFGQAVSLSGDGTTVAIGAPKAGPYDKMSGQVTVYRIDSTGPKQLGESIEGDNFGDFFGSSVDISFDGSIIAVGSPRYYEVPGYVRVFSLVSDDAFTNGDWKWKQIGQTITRGTIGDYFGTSVSLSDDGKTLAVGAPGNTAKGDDPGHIRVYQMNDSDSDWVQLCEEIDGEVNGDESGWSVSLSGDGNMVAIGSPNHKTDNGELAGQVRVFKVE